MDPMTKDGGSATKRTLSAVQSDRAAGVMWGQACGDALGAGYEFGRALSATTPVAMVGGGLGWAPGEWTDDTQMAIPILEAAERAARHGDDLVDHLDGVSAAWAAWAIDANDVGNQTRAILGEIRARGTLDAESLLAASRAFARSGARAAGNGSLMRTSPVALAHLGDDEKIATAARLVSDLTHADPEAGDACVLWCLAISHAVLTGEIDVRRGLDRLPEARRGLWTERIDEAELNSPASFTKNGWVVQAFQGAWSAISTTPIPELDPGAGTFPAQHFRRALENAVRGGHDTDTVAAIAGQLLGARWGASAVPGDWRRIVHGWPKLRGQELASRGLVVARGGGDDKDGWPSTDRIDYAPWGARGRLVAHPHDPGLLLGDAAVLDSPPAEVDAIVSLCRVGNAVPRRVAPGHHIEVWLIDSSDPESNPNLDFVLADVADTVAAMRADGRTVLLHCVAAQSRTPSAAAAYSIRHLGRDPGSALDEVCAVLPDARPNSGFRDALQRMGPGGLDRGL